jgi:predicted Rossmann fold nucleotide-binding protein DprA/Smf involved in DNA uptake
MDSEENIRAGELLERLGNKKSRVVVAALNALADDHPELESENAELKLTVQSVSMELLEMKIRQMIEEKLGGVTVPEQLNMSAAEQVDNVSQDILDMLGDLELF